MAAHPFRFYLVARVSVGLADAILSVTLGWHLYRATGNAFDLALVGLMQIIPMWCLFLVSGWVVDRFPRKRILLTCAALECAITVSLAAIMADGQVDRVTTFTLLFLLGCSRAFFRPAFQAILPAIVEREQLSRAVALAGTAWTTASTAGPFVAGLLLAWIDFGTYWLLAGFAAVTLASFLPLPAVPAQESSGRGIRALLDGIRYVFSNGIVLPSIALDMLIVLFGSVMALLPVFAVDVLQVGPEALGLLRAMPALGAVAMGVLLAHLPPLRYTGRLLFASLAVFALSVLVFGLSQHLWLSLVALCIYGASDMISVNIRSTLIQLATPDALRGRVGAVNALFVSTSNDLGDFRAGSVAAAIGPVVTVVAGAGMALAVTAGGYALCKTLRGLDRIHDVDSGEGTDAGKRVA